MSIVAADGGALASMSETPKTAEAIDSLAFIDFGAPTSTVANVDRTWTNTHGPFSATVESGGDAGALTGITANW